MIIMQVNHGNPRQAAQIAYAAGLIDGEGTVRINKMRATERNQSKQPHYVGLVAIGMVTPTPLKFLQGLFNCGTIREERVPNARSIWRWTINAKSDVVTLLDAVRPYLLVKHEQADLVIDFIKNKKPPFNRKAGLSEEEIRWREDVYQKVRKLNAVGAAATTK